MNMIEALGEKVKITMVDGAVYVGVATDYFHADETEYGEASFSIGDIEVFEKEIKKIESI